MLRVTLSTTICSAALAALACGCNGNADSSKSINDSFLCAIMGCDYEGLCTVTGDPFWCALADIPVPQPLPPELCVPTESPAELTCDDTVDNDCDGLIDWQDLDCPHLCGDINRNGHVDDLDRALLAGCFGFNAPGPGCDQDTFAGSDLNRDGWVNLKDMATFAALYGLPPSGSPPDCYQPAP